MATYSNRGLRTTITTGTASFDTAQTLVLRADISCAFTAFCIINFTTAGTGASITTSLRNKDNLAVGTFTSANSTISAPNINPHFFRAASALIDSAHSVTRICDAMGNQLATGFSYVGSEPRYASLGQCVILYPGEYIYLNGSNNTNTASWVAYTHFPG